MLEFFEIDAAWLMGKLGFILKIAVECLARNTTGFYDFLDRDFFDRSSFHALLHGIREFILYFLIHFAF